MNKRAASLMAGNAVLAGILVMLLGDFMFALNDAMGKWLVASFSVGQVLLIRSVGAFLCSGRCSLASRFRPSTRSRSCRCM